MTDHILFVKETKICSYVLVIHTPRLCGEPGFKSRGDAEEQARIRCREIVDKKPEDQAQLPPAEHPINHPMRKTVLPAPKLREKPTDASESRPGSFIDDVLRKTLRALVGGQKGERNEQGEDEVVIEFLDADGENPIQLDNEQIVEALRTAGYDVQGGIITLNTDSSEDGDDRQDDEGEETTDTDTQQVHDLHRDHDDHDEL